jgi:hypothetical protein
MKFKLDIENKILIPFMILAILPSRSWALSPIGRVIASDRRPDKNAGSIIEGGDTLY